MAAERYGVLTEGFIPATAKLIRIVEGAVDVAVVAAGTPTDMRLLANKLNAAEAVAPVAPPEE
ncbi:hypothetical protein PQE12_gp54 [Arthrobacter phage Adumb2043]|uniref:Uncharacterized protein n=1 Tax=Arthrobacter phage Adumb2043 TaxID=2776851 RepID=A0A7M1CLL0_9CAUD|nr:hypothetical protein PQE12_gp54 [Arthrobacter phage Adumb2043]QOP65114.1 hypothetical protein SEA_ADUMB2043_54 [Arthrobacter phage Adumb2043]